MHGAKTAWVTWFLGFLLVSAGWALVTPINSYPDEVDHVVRAASVVRGEIFPHIGPYTHGTGAITEIPVKLRNAALRVSCAGRLTQDSVCMPSGPDYPSSVIVATSEGRRFPLYYALVGWPSLAFPDTTGWFLMRLASAVLCSVFLASAAYVMMSMRRRPLVLAAGLFVGLTPLALNLAGSVNPSGLEVATAVCFWAVALAMVHETSSVRPRRLLALGVVSGVVLATCRELGWVWILLAVFLALVSAEPGQRDRFNRSSAGHVVIVCTIVATVVVAAWSLAFRSYVVFYTPPPGDTGWSAAVHAHLHHVGKLLLQILAYLGPLTLPPPVIAVVCWTAAIAVLLTFVLVTSPRVGAAVLFGCALVLLIPFLVQVAEYRTHGLGGWQGRYTLPLAAGLPLLAVAPTRARDKESGWVAVPAVVVIVLTLWGQFAVFASAWWAVQPNTHWYISLGYVFLASGAVVVLATVARAEVGWVRRRATPEPAPLPSPVPRSNGVPAALSGATCAAE